MTTPSGGGMEHGEDFIAARVSIEVSGGTDDTLDRLIDKVNRTRTAMEMMARATGETNDVLNKMAEAAKMTENAMERLSNMQLSGATDMSVPIGKAQAAPGANVPGMGQMVRDPASGLYLMPKDREYANGMHQRGMFDGPEHVTVDNVAQVGEMIAEREHKQEEQDRLTRVTGLISGAESAAKRESKRAMGDIFSGDSLPSRMAREIGTHGANSAIAYVAQRGRQWAKRRFGAGSGVPGSENAGGEDDIAEAGEEAGTASAEAGAAGGMLGRIAGIAKFGAVVGGVIGGLKMLWSAFQDAGQKLQEFRNVGSIRGGDAMEGAVATASMKLTAMNPFITQDQARQIYQAAMGGGFADASGQGADNVIDFMQHNITAFNTNVATSMAMLKDTIIGEGDGSKMGVNKAVTLLNEELERIKETSRDTVISQPQFQKDVAGIQKRAMDMGVSPEMAAQSAITAESVMGDSQTMKGQFGLASGDFDSPTGGAFLMQYGGPGGRPMQLPPGMLPQVFGSYLQDQGGDKYNQAVMNTLQAQVQLAEQSSMDERSQNFILQQRLQGMGLGNLNAASSLSAAAELRKAVDSGDMTAALKQAESRSSEGNSRGGQSTSMGSGVSVSGAVTIDLTPRAAAMLQPQGGGKQVRLTQTQKRANRGEGDAQVNDDSEY